MTSPILEKIKPVIDFSLVSKFDTKDMQTNSYIPICIAKGSVYVLVKTTTRQNDVLSVIYKVLGTDKVNFKNVSDSDFSLILSFVIGSIHLESADNVDVSEQGTSSEIQLHYDNDENIEDDAVEDGDEHHSDEKYFSKKNW